jgi:hypothetical protein
MQVKTFSIERAASSVNLGEALGAAGWVWADFEKSLKTIRQMRPVISRVMGSILAVMSQYSQNADFVGNRRYRELRRRSC